jgi:mannose-6-phosphate isomerase-like protein (cupin superfamily)
MDGDQMSGPFERVRVTTTRVEKPWGYEIHYALTERYCGKMLFVRSGEALSLQYHERKEESWYVETGRAMLEVGPHGAERDVVEIRPGDAFHFVPGTVHRVTALEDTLILEVSTPELDDVVRLEDRYERAG